MKFPKEVNVYCPKCRKYTKHKVKRAKKRSGEGRTLAKGNRKHKRRLQGHGGKRDGKMTVRKQGKRQKVMLTCDVCKKKHEKVLAGRTKKKVEIGAK